ncbi:family 20 glycosylhydrolase [Kinneretia aquatilis]|uniref:family 20 glycosylhydrolase n=1 Tax=Kinneretia aquatilis TaxID=2070761 RepID=UPI00149528A7|nr:family 20 glycosylhydrolase [Paucibacter aquatile]WIV98010.1 family 20 glycosylhydrolase [Paucibacter aquatile]
MSIAYMDEGVAAAAAGQKPRTPLQAWGHSLMPWPAQLQGRAGELPLAGWCWPEEGPPTLRALARRLLPDLQATAAAEGKVWLRLEISDTSPAIPQLGDDESYRLEIAPSEGEIRLSAPRLWGAQHGLHTLSQLRHGALLAGRATLPGLLIEDAPRHPWRGLLVDVARRPLPFDTLTRLLDGMAAARLNVLHWHVCDDQAWRLASERHPELAARASAGFSYSLAQARSLVAQAAERGIRVVPELDLPGHCWALGLARPDLLCPPAPQQAQRGFGIFGAAVDPRQPALYDFIASLLDEWAEVFPDAFVHIGGDELAPEPWRRLGLPLAETQAGYVRRMAELLAARGKRLVGWDELRGPGLPEAAVLQCWRGAAALQADDAPEQDLALAPALLRSAGFYLDQFHGAAFHWRTPLSQPAPTTPPLAPGAARWRLQAQLTLHALHAELRCDARGRAQLLLQAQGPGSLHNEVPLHTLSIEGTGTADLPWRLRARGDCDLGELELWCTMSAQGPGEGVLRLGNLRHRCTLQALEPTEDETAARATTHIAPRPRLLGGEAALWSELVAPEQLDLRLWPRLLAVAERLWSDPAPEAAALGTTLPTRLGAAQAWAEQHAGAQARASLQRAWAALCEGDAGDALSLAGLAALLEPAGGYARHHDKKREGRYHLDEPLARLADALPAESAWALRLNQLSRAEARAQLRRCRDALPEWQALLQRHARLRPLLPVLPTLAALLDLGLRLWQDLAPGALPAAERALAQATLHSAAQMVDELVPALVQALQARLDAL